MVRGLQTQAPPNVQMRADLEQGVAAKVSNAGDMMMSIDGSNSIAKKADSSWRSFKR